MAETQEPAAKVLCVCGKRITPKKDGTLRTHICNPPAARQTWEGPYQPVVSADVDETDEFVSPTPAADPQPFTPNENNKGPWVPARFAGELDCAHFVAEGDEIRADGEGGWECRDCGDVRDEDAYATAHHVHYFVYADDENGHSGSFCECGMEEPSSPVVELLASVDLDEGPCRGCEDCSTAPDTAANWNGTGRPRPSAATVKLPPAEPVKETPRLLDTLAAARTEVHAEVPAPAPGGDLFVSPTPQGSGPVRGTADAAADPFTAPTKVAAPLGSATDQPETWRNRYGQYVIKDPRTGDYKRNRRGVPQGFTRATTYAKTLIDQFGIHQWEVRNVIAGLARRPDLVQRALGLDVTEDRDALQDIANLAKDAAGANLASSDGTDFHTVTEWIDAGRMDPEDAPEKFREEALAYAGKMSSAGLTVKPEWIERVVFSDRGGEDVAGTADRIVLERDGTPVIADVKSGKGVDLGQREIAMQLKHYAVAVNQFGLYRKTSEPPRTGTDDPAQTGHWEPWTGAPVSEEYGIIMHVPLIRPVGTPAYCDLYRIDLRGVEPMDVSRAHHAAGWVREWRKQKGFLSPYSPPAPRLGPPAAVDPVLAAWEKSFRSVTTPDQANQLWQAAVDVGMDSATLDVYVALARVALAKTTLKAQG